MTTYTLGDNSVPGISAMAAKTTVGKLLLALLKQHPNKPAVVVAGIAGYTAQSAVGRIQSGY